MTDRHRGGGPRGFDRDRRPNFEGGRGEGGDRGGRRSPFRDQRPPAPPAEAEDEFEEVDTTLAVAILDTATRLTALIVDKGLPTDLEGRRAAVLEEFGAVYATVLETVTSLDDEEDDEDEDGEE